MREIEQLYLSWFPSLQLPLAEDVISISDKQYFHFSTQVQFASGKMATAHGKSISRRTAALKCISECIERKAMFDFYHTDTFKNDIDLSKIISRNSNGWAVHLNQDLAKKASYTEAIERHLLLKTFLQYGWQGFKLVNQSEVDGLKVYFLQASITTHNYTAGLVLTQSNRFPGVTIGSTAGLKAELGISYFWEGAWLESLFKMKVFEDHQQAEPSGWIEKEIYNWINEPFDSSILDNQNSVSQIVEADPEASFVELNLREYLSAPIDIYACYSFGKDLIPLFHWPSLKNEEKALASDILKNNGIFHEPLERMPIL